MSSIKAFECLTGHISGLCTLSGELSCKGGLSGKLSAVINYNVYSGEYEVVPSAFNTQVLPTANKVLKKDVTVQKVPYFETSNVQNGVTVYIAEEVTTDSKGQKLVKKFSNNMLNMEAVLTDAAGKELARLTKVFSTDGKDISSTVVYGK